MRPARGALSAMMNRHRADRGQHAFSLVEMLVVMAITVILLGLLFGPIISSFNFVARAQATSEAQEAARRVLQQVTRDVKDAVQIAASAGDTLRLPQADDTRIRTQGVRSLGYIDAFDGRGLKHPLFGALLDFLPADDTLGLHGGSLSNPPVPQIITGATHTHETQQGTTVAAEGAHNVVVRYFVGLKDPGYPHQNANDRWSGRNGAPVWANSNVSADVLGAANIDNPYVLYRIEFDAGDPAFGDWAIPDPNFKGKAADAPLVINPDFFYDNDPAPNGVPYWVNWRRNAVAQTATNDIDLVRFVTDANGNVTQTQSTVTFTPTVVQNDAAVPAPGQEGSPLSYVTTHGNWTGVQNDGSLTAADYNPPALGVYPHITVYESAANNTNGPTAYRLAKVYDNWATNGNDPARPGNSRVLTWDSKSGTVRFLAGAPTGTGGAQEFTSTVTMGPTDNGWELDPLEVAVQQGLINRTLRKYVRFVPGSEVIRVTYQYPSDPADPNSPTTTRTDTFQRNASNRMLDTPPQPADWNAALKGPYPTALPEPGTYMTDPDTGRILLGFPWPGPNNPLRPQPIPSMYHGQPPKIYIRFAYQTNLPQDVVRVDYATRSLLNITMGIRMFDPATSRPIVVQLNDKAAMRNLGR